MSQCSQASLTLTFVFLFILLHKVQVMRDQKRRVLSLYTPAKNEKISEAKRLHLLDRVVPLLCFFRHRLAGKNKGKAAGIVAEGCLMHARTIQRLTQQFLSSTFTTYSKTGKQVRSKPRLEFTPFHMGFNKNNVSIMHDERVRARAIVWMRLYNVKRKGKPNLRSRDFLKFLREDLLKDIGVMP